MKPLTLKDYSSTTLDKRITEAEKRGWKLTQKGKNTKVEYPYYWAVLHQEWGK